MKFRKLPWVALILGFSLMIYVSMNKNVEEPYSPLLSDTAIDCVGSGHTFGEGVMYTIDRAGICNGEEYRILTSHESDVRIWSKDGRILFADLGSKVEFIDDDIVIHPL